MTPKAIAQKVVTLLGASAHLKLTINGVATQTPVLTGIDGPDFVFDNSLPYIVMTPAANPLIRKLQGDVAENRLTLMLYGYIPVRDRQISVFGETAFPGVFDIEAGIKAALTAYYPSLDGTALHFTMSATGYGVHAEGTGRIVEIELAIDYRE